MPIRRLADGMTDTAYGYFLSVSKNQIDRKAQSSIAHSPFTFDVSRFTIIHQNPMTLQKQSPNNTNNQ